MALLYGQGVGERAGTSATREIADTLGEVGYERGESLATCSLYVHIWLQYMCVLAALALDGCALWHRLVRSAVPFSVFAPFAVPPRSHRRPRGFCRYSCKAEAV